MSRFALTAIAFAATACLVFADDPKTKAKARAAAALALAKAADVAKVAAAAPLTDLEKAKLKALADGKPLIVWVGKDAPKDAAKRAPTAIHAFVEKLSGTDAKCVVYDCRGEKCEQKSSVKEYPSPALLKTLLEDLPAAAPQTKKTAAPEFFIGTDMAPAETEEADSPPATRTVWRQVCEGGICRWVAVEETVSTPPVVTPSKLATGSDGCPCVAAYGSCPCAAKGSRPVLARVQAVRGWWQERPRLFSFAPLFARFHR